MFVNMLLKDAEHSRQSAVEGLAYASLQPTVKEQLSQNDEFLEILVATLDGAPPRSPLTYGALTILANLTKYQPVQSRKKSGSPSSEPMQTRWASSSPIRSTTRRTSPRGVNGCLRPVSRPSWSSTARAYYGRHSPDRLDSIFSLHDSLSPRTAGPTRRAPTDYTASRLALQTILQISTPKRGGLPSRRLPGYSSPSTPITSSSHRTPGQKRPSGR